MRIASPQHPRQQLLCAVVPTHSTRPVHSSHLSVVPVHHSIRSVRIRTSPARQSSSMTSSSTAPQEEAPAAEGTKPQHQSFCGKGFTLKRYTDVAGVYRPSNPKWLVEAVQWTPDTIPAAFLPVPPPLQRFKESLGPDGRLGVQFGSDACRALFGVDFDAMTYLNHGSYGAASRLSLEVQGWYRQQLEAEPVAFMETVAVAGQVAAAAQVAQWLGADWQDVVPVVNATSAVNTVVNSLQLGPGDLLLMNNATYPAVKSTLAAAAQRSGAQLLELVGDARGWTDPDALVAAYEGALAAGGGSIKLVVVDHVVSFPPLVLPVERICAACRAAGVPVLVDGAHAVGALPGLDVASLGADYYTTNLHKWLCTPKGCAVLWVAPAKQHQVHPLVTSHGYSLGFRGEFLWQGTADVTPWLTAPASLAFLEALGPADVVQYNHGLVKQAVQVLTKAWGPGLAVLGIGTDGSTAGMAAVQLPAGLQVPAGAMTASGVAAAAAGAEAAGTTEAAADGSTCSSSQEPLPYTPAGAVALNRLLRQAHHVEVPVACMEGRLFVRISAQVYNRLADYQRLAEVVASMRAAAAGG